MKATSALLITPLLWRWVMAESADTNCINGIRTALAEIVFDGTDPKDYWGNICTNNLSVTSMWATAMVYCTERERIAGEDMLSEYCTEYGSVTLTPYDDVLPLLTDEFIKALPQVNFKDVDAPAIWNNSVILSEKLFTASTHTVVCTSEWIGRISLTIS